MQALKSPVQSAYLSNGKSDVFLSCTSSFTCMTIHSFTHTPFSRQTGQTSLKTGRDHNTRHHTDLAVGLKAGTDHNTKHHTDLAVGLKTGTDHNTKHHTDLATGLKVELHGQTSLNIGTDHITQYRLSHRAESRTAWSNQPEHRHTSHHTTRRHDTKEHSLSHGG